MKADTIGVLRHKLETALKDAESQDADSVRAATLRLVLCAARDRDATARSQGECEGCPETRLHELLATMAEQRRTSAREYDEAGRIVDAEREREELDVIESFMTGALAPAELDEAVQAVIIDLEANRLKDVGRCMTELKERYPGQIDACEASRAIRRALS